MKVYLILAMYLIGGLVACVVLDFMGLGFIFQFILLAVVINVFIKQHIKDNYND